MLYSVARVLLSIEVGQLARALADCKPTCATPAIALAALVAVQHLVGVDLSVTAVATSFSPFHVISLGNSEYNIRDKIMNKS